MDLLVFSALSVRKSRLSTQTQCAKKRCAPLRKSALPVCSITLQPSGSTSRGSCKGTMQPFLESFTLGRGRLTDAKSQTSLTKSCTLLAWQDGRYQIRVQSDDSPALLKTSSENPNRMFCGMLRHSFVAWKASLHRKLSAVFMCLRRKHGKCTTKHRQHCVMGYHCCVCSACACTAVNLHAR